MSLDKHVGGIPPVEDEVELEHFDLRLIAEHFERLEELLDACPIKIYAASYTKHPWPYRLQHAGECYDATFSRSNHRLLDSGFDNPELDNEDVLAKAVDRDATEVVAKDYVGDQDRTTASLEEFVELHDPDVHPPAYVPLQPPYDEHFHDVAGLVDDSHLSHRYMLGGLAKETNLHPYRPTPAVRVQQARDFRDAAGYDVLAHGLGWGLQPELVVELRRNPELLDQLDNSGPSQTVRGGDVILDRTWKERDYDLCSGGYRNLIGGTGEIFVLIQAVQQLTEYTTDYDDESAHPSQSGLGGWGA